MTKLPSLTPDDPLRAATAAPNPPPTPSTTKSQAEPGPDPPAVAPAPPTPAATPAGRARTRTAPSTTTATSGPSELDAEWSGSTDVTTARMPTEVLRLLRRRSRELGLPIGMILTAGLVNVLADRDEDLVDRVDATQARYDQARRRASRTG